MSGTATSGIAALIGELGAEVTERGGQRGERERERTRHKHKQKDDQHRSELFVCVCVPVAFFFFFFFSQSIQSAQQIEDGQLKDKEESQIDTAFFLE
jgi:hypothetical protein